MITFLRKFISAIVAIILIVAILAYFSPGVRRLIMRWESNLDQYINLEKIKEIKNEIFQKIKSQFQNSQRQIKTKLPQFQFKFSYWLKQLKKILVPQSSTSPKQGR